MTGTRVALTAASSSPLDPSPDRADELLRRELLRPEYHDQNLMQRFLGWLSERLDAGLNAATGVSPIGVVGACILFLVLLLLIGLLVSRARRNRRARPEAGAVLTAERLSAAELRRRADAALAAGDPGGAVVEAFRAITVRQVERGRLVDQPGATAHEVASSLGAAYPEHRGRVDGAALLFDVVLYGERPATSEQAHDVLALDDELAGVR